ncbi:MAG: SH3 domain-containing protein [Armatimonadetes bacterium]|nr:SH3 domain-containing protein [Anaerolineae bacterium]
MKIDRYTKPMSLLLLTLPLVALLLFTSEDIWQAQEAPAPTAVSAVDCGVPLSQFWLSASDACVGKPFGFVCNGGFTPLAEPAGAVSNSLASVGALVDITQIDAMRTPPFQPTGVGGGLVWLRVAAEDSPLRFSGLMVGDVGIRDLTPDGFPNWQNFVVETIDRPERCETAPYSAFVVQSLPGSTSRVVINGVSLDVNGTSVVQTENAQTHFMALSGDLTLLTGGLRATIFAGQETTLVYAPGNYTAPQTAPAPAAAFRPERVQHLPTLLFDIPVVIPEAGVAATQGPVNLRTAPNTDAAILIQVPGGERLTLLARSPDGSWVHVRLADGQSGWMFAELLNADLEGVRSVYLETPAPLQRMGDLGQSAQVIAPNGVTLRAAPDISFATISVLPFGLKTTLLNRSPYSPWVKVDVDGTIGWVPLIALETRAIIEALLIDYDVPPPPEPTRIPGSFGNAFPNPNCFPNCG